MNSNQQSITPLESPPKTPNWLTFSFLGISFLGFADAGYLTAKHYLGTPIPCSILNGCDTVTKSIYATVFGVPISLLGALYYLVLFMLVLVYLDSEKTKFFLWASRLTWTGFLVSVVLVFLQIFVIKALCLYCLGSALTSTALFVLGMRFVKMRYN